MDQLLERDANAPEMIAEMSSGGLDSTLDDTHHDSQMLTQDESQIEAQQMSQDEEVCIFFSKFTSRSAHRTPNFTHPKFQFPQFKVVQSVFFFHFNITSYIGIFWCLLILI